MIPLQNTPAELWGKAIVVYDLETKKPIGGEIGWTDYDKMGISFGAAFDYRTGDYTLYFDDNIHELVGLLNGADLVVGFNQRGFDNNLLRGSGLALKPEAELCQYDILEHARRGIGWVPGGFYPKGLKLDYILKATFGESCMKTGDGAMAPVQYQQGKLGALSSYGLADVDRTRFLFESIWENRQVKSDMHGVIQMANPSDFMPVKTIPAVG